MSIEPQLIRKRLNDSYSSVVKYLNVSKLCMKLVEEKLLSPREVHNNITDAERLIERVEEKGLSAYSKLYLCITKETDHFGHRYVQAVLEDEKYASAPEMEHSIALGEALNTNLHQLGSCDLMKLFSHMYSRKLLTHDEWIKLSKTQWVSDDLLIHIAAILDSKGPLAYSMFAECLQSVDSEVYKLVFQSQAETPATECASPASRHSPPKLKLHGCLKGKRYNTIMKMFQKCHHNGQWVELELEVKKLMSPDTPKELQVVALLESAVSWVFRRREKQVLDLVARAKEITAQVDRNNSKVLSGRCEYILSRLYRYLQQYDKAHEHILKATYLLHMVEEGEDMAFLHYCDACIQVETLTEHPTQEELHSVDLTYKHAIYNARAHDSGLDLVAPHSFMRLAQMYLGSRHYSAGSPKDDLRVSKASNCLQAVNQCSLSRRSQCHYLLMESDLKRCQKNIPQAKLAAQKALELANTSNFTIEIASAEERIDSL